ncbi:MAG: hypothetical protein K0S09_23 [Sphingobacteriaceae bacterium]|jgi:hypothetical protein|nr:hypothetical protein [Sphingobacteriaceae bacterium]
MSVSVIDGFDFPSETADIEDYRINFDNAFPGTISVDYLGLDGEKSTVTNFERGRDTDELIGNFLSDDGSVSYEILASLNTPFAYIASTTPVDPAPPSCDLAFTSVTASNETEQGGNDGSVTAVASTSFTGLEYSLNGSDWQVSGVFSGLQPGNYVVYAHDDNGCLIQYAFTIEAFNNPISGGFTAGLPVVQVSTNNLSKWNAAFNPIVINFQRNDNAIFSVADAGGGYIDIKINGLYDAGQEALALATSVVVKGAKYDINQPAFSVAVDGGRSVLRFLSSYFGSDTGVVFIEQSKPNYKIEIEIKTGATPYTLKTVTGTWSPNLSGFVRADLQAYLQSIVSAKDEFKYDALNWKDGNLSASFTIRFKEVWDGSNNPWYDAPYPLYVTYSAKQLGDTYGGNMAEYVPFYNEPNEDLKAKFLTDFAEPSHWVGLPWDISFIFSESIVGTPIKVRASSLDVNKNLIGGGVVNSFLLNGDAGFLTAAAASQFIIQNGALPPVDQADIIEALGINRLMMPGTPAANVEYIQLQLYRGTDEAPFFITQPVIVKVNTPCDNDPYIYLKWMNKLGGWNYWRFGYRQDYSLSTSNDTKVNRNVFDWANDDTITDIIKKSANKSVQFGAIGLDVDQAKGLESLATSIKVQMLSKVSPIKWQTVELNTGSFQLYNTRGNLFDVKFTIQLPDINIQRQ